MAAVGFAMQGANSIGGAYVSSRAMQAQGDYQQRVSEMNARSTELQAEDAIKRGASAAVLRNSDTVKAVGSQRAALAAQGLDANSEMANDLTSESRIIGAQDEAAIKTNSWREAMGYRSQAVNMRLEGKTANMAAQNTARSTMMTGFTEGVSYGLKSYGAGVDSRDSQSAADEKSRSTSANQAFRRGARNGR